MYRVGIIGAGFVGTAVSVGFETLLSDTVEIREYDKYKDTESLQSVVENSTILFVCVPTPTDFNTGQCDISIVESVVKEINDIEKHKHIVLKSTCPPGTTKHLSKQYPEQEILFCPEFLTEKNFINDFLTQDRIILGYPDYPKISTIHEDVYCLFNAFAKAQKSPAKLLEVDSSVAEMTKYVGNCFLASKVIFCNEMYQVCNAANIDYKEVAKLVALDKRIGSSHMQVPGSDGKFGTSGKCFPKDMNSLIFFAKSLGVDPLVLESLWTKNLIIRDDHDWETIPGATTENMDFKKNE